MNTRVLSISIVWGLVVCATFFGSSPVSAFEIPLHCRVRFEEIVEKERQAQAQNYRVSPEESESLHLKAPERPPVNFKQDSAIVREVVSLVVKADFASQHTLGVKQYIERHISQNLFEWLVNNPKVHVSVLQADIPEIVAFLHKSGFDDIQVLPSNSKTDFDKVIAYNKSTGEGRLVLGLLEGESYLHEVLANLLSYEFMKDGTTIRLDPSRITVYRSNRSLKKQFMSILRAKDVDPDVVVFAYASNFAKVMGEQGVLPTSDFFERELSSRIYKIKGKVILSVNIEPELYGDRAGKLVEAVQSLSAKHRAFVVIGTAGSLSKDISFGDYVAPSVFSHSNSGAAGSSIKVQNRALQILTGKDQPGRTLHLGQIKHVAVDSILYEDIPWLQAQGYHGRGGASIVEQEGFGIASAVSRKNDSLFAIYRISDVPVAHQDFSLYEHRLGVDSTLSSVQLSLFGGALSSVH